MDSYDWESSSFSIIEPDTLPLQLESSTELFVTHGRYPGEVIDASYETQQDDNAATIEEMLEYQTDDDDAVDDLEQAFEKEWQQYQDSMAQLTLMAQEVNYLVQETRSQSQVVKRVLQQKLASDSPSSRRGTPSKKGLSQIADSPYEATPRKTPRTRQKRSSTQAFSPFFRTVLLFMIVGILLWYHLENSQSLF